MIGIVTPWKVMNYGTKLQAYAMQELMSAYEPAELMGFVPGTDKRPNAVLGKMLLRASREKRRPLPPALKEEQLKRQRAIAAFDQRYRFGPEVRGNRALRALMPRYGAVVCGSDQLWAPKNVLADYFTLTLFPDSLNRFSYAASFGVSRVPALLKSRYRKFLNRLSHISVREEQGKALVRELSGREAALVADPTLMLPAEKWRMLAGQGRELSQGRYVLCYFLGGNWEHRAFARGLAEKTGCRVAAFPHFREFQEADEGFADTEIYKAGPEDFLRLILEAEYVCTDSFHAAVFSILFHKRLAVLERFSGDEAGSTNGRIHTLLAALGVEQSLFAPGDDTCRLTDGPAPYEEAEKRLAALRDRSFAYLDGAVGHPRMKKA